LRQLLAKIIGGVFIERSAAVSDATHGFPCGVCWACLSSRSQSPCDATGRRSIAAMATTTNSVRMARTKMWCVARATSSRNVRPFRTRSELVVRANREHVDVTVCVKSVPNKSNG
jgi:hypothetical protein